MKTTNNIKAFMKSCGFELVREKKHYVWRDADGVQIVTAKTISDHRAIANIKKTIAKVRANRQSAH